MLPYKLVTCEDVLSDDFDLHLQWMLGGVSDLSSDVCDLANEHGGQELCLLHPNQSCQTAVLERKSMSSWDTFNQTMTSLIIDDQ